MYKKILFYSFLIFFLLFSITPTQSKVSNGFIDLKNYNFSKNGPLNLDGEWSFYWNTFLNPTDLKNKDLEKQKISAKIPGSWVKGKTGHLPNLGHGTYLLKVKGLVKNKDMSLSLKDIPSAFKVFIVQKQIVKEIGGKGQVSPTKKGSRPQYGSFIGDFQVNENSFFILIHVSNYHYRIGGLNDIPKLGLKDDIHKQAKTKHYQFFFVLGLFLMMGVNHFSIFFQRREDKGSLWFGLFCFTLMLRSLSIESYFEFLFFCTEMIFF